MRPVSINPLNFRTQQYDFQHLATKYVIRNHLQYCIFPNPAVGNKRNELVVTRDLDHAEFGVLKLFALIKVKNMHILLRHGSCRYKMTTRRLCEEFVYLPLAADKQCEM